MPTTFRARSRFQPPRLDPLALHGLYFVVTGLWPVVNLRSFYAVTGPKREGWLVQTFGLLVAALGLGMLRSRAAPDRRGAVRLGVLTGLALALADVLFVARGRIRPVYLLDAVTEVAAAVAYAVDGRTGDGRTDGCLAMTELAR